VRNYTPYETNLEGRKSRGGWESKTFCLHLLRAPVQEESFSTIFKSPATHL
jgi:hypothetical protein